MKNKHFVFFILLLSHLVFSGYSPIVSSSNSVNFEKKICGPQIWASNQNPFDDNNLYQIKLINLQRPLIFTYQPALNYGDPDLLLENIPGGYYNIRITYYSDNPFNSGYLYLISSGRKIECAPCVFGTQTITFSNVYLTCGYYTVAVGSTPC